MSKTKSIVLEAHSRPLLLDFRTALEQAIKEGLPFSTLTSVPAFKSLLEAPSPLVGESSATVLQVDPSPSLQDQWIPTQQGQIIVPDHRPLHLLVDKRGTQA